MNVLDALLNQPAADPQHWLLDPARTFLIHGAFGACLRAVLAAQTESRALEPQALWRHAQCLRHQGRRGAS